MGDAVGLGAAVGNGVGGRVGDGVTVAVGASVGVTVAVEAAAEGTMAVGSTPLQARMPMAINNRPANKRSFPTLPILQSRNLTAVELPHAVPERGAPRLMPPGIGLGPPFV